MISTKYSVYEKRQFIETLEYAKRKLKEEEKNKKITPKYYRYEAKKINNLINIINGNYHEDYFDMCSKSYRQKVNVGDETVGLELPYITD